jgi:hypothetical protein
MFTILNLTTTAVTSVRTPASGKKQGARLIFTDDLRDKAASPATPPIGQHSGVCVLVREPDTWFCRAGWFLPNGNLVAGGLIDFSAPNFAVAIFGGTGAYKDARGEIRGTPGGSDLTLEILP